MVRTVISAKPLLTGLLLCGAILSAWGTWYFWTSSGAGRAMPRPSVANSALASELSGISGIQPAELAPALLTDYYEHKDEHAPPRLGGGVMQRREWYYRAPRDPFSLLPMKLGNAAADLAVRKELVKLQTLWQHGGVFPTDLSADLETLLGQCSLDAETLIEAGRALVFLCDDEVAAAFYRAGLEQALRQYQGARAGDPAALPLLQQLAQTKALRRLSDNSALEKRFALEMSLYPALSVEARRAGCLWAEALMNQGKAAEAAEAIVRVYEQDNAAGDLGLYDSSDVGDMDWRAGVYLTHSGRWQEAIPYLQHLLKTSDARKPTAVQLWIVCLHRLQRDDEAESVRQRYKLSSPGTTPAPASRPTTSLPPAGSPVVSAQSFTEE